MMIRCPICGKLAAVHWPEHWVYRRGDTYYCSDQCMDSAIHRDMKKMNMVLMNRRKLKIGKENDMKNHKLTLEQKKKAMQIFQEQDSTAAASYLKECGAKNPWAALDYIKKTMMKNAEPTLGDAMQGMKDATDAFFTGCKEAGLNLDKPVTAGTVETPEGGWIPARQVIPPTKEEPLPFTDPPEEDTGYVDGFQIATIRGEFGEYRAEGDDFVFENPVQTIRFCGKAWTKGDWKAFLTEVQRAAKVLGVIQ